MNGLLGFRQVNRTIAEHDAQRCKLASLLCLRQEGAIDEGRRALRVSLNALIASAICCFNLEGFQTSRRTLLIIRLDSQGLTTSVVEGMNA